MKAKILAKILSPIIGRTIISKSIPAKFIVCDVRKIKRSARLYETHDFLIEEAGATVSDKGIVLVSEDVASVVYEESSVTIIMIDGRKAQIDISWEVKETGDEQCQSKP